MFLNLVLYIVKQTTKIYRNIFAPSPHTTLYLRKGMQCREPKKGLKKIIFEIQREYFGGQYPIISLRQPLSCFKSWSPRQLLSFLEWRHPGAHQAVGKVQLVAVNLNDKSSRVGLQKKSQITHHTLRPLLFGRLVLKLSKI